MMNQAPAVLVSGASPDATPSPAYVGYWPMTQWTGAVGALTYNSITLAATTYVDTTNNWISGVTSATWLTAGVPFKIRPVGTIPAGLSSSLVYYAGKPTADRVQFHTTYADAIAGTNPVDITTQGTSNVVLYPAFIKDWSGNGNDMLFGAATSDLQAFATAPYMSNASSGANDNALGRLSAATFADAFVWPTSSMFVHFRVLFGTLVAGRSFWGCGNSSPAVSGPRMSVDSSDTSKLNLQFFHSGGTISIGASAAEACSTTVQHSIALGIDGPARQATIWIDGVRDLSLNQDSLNAAVTATMTGDLRIGGAYSTNAQAANFADYHVLTWVGGLPSNIDAVAAKLATVKYQRLMESEVA